MNADAQVAALQMTSGLGVLVALIVCGSFFLAWIVSLFLLGADTISVFGKVIWFALLTCLAPFAIPLYLILRHHRTSQAVR